MKLDTKQKLIGPDKKEISFINAKGENENTLAHILTNALNGNFEDERNLRDSKKIERFMLAEKLFSDIPVEWTMKDVRELDLVASKMYPAIIYGAINKTLEGSKGETIEPKNDTK